MKSENEMEGQAFGGSRESSRANIDDAELWNELPLGSGSLNGSERSDTGLPNLEIAQMSPARQASAPAAERNDYQDRQMASPQSDRPEEKRPQETSDDTARPTNNDLPSGDRPESEESRQNRLINESLYQNGQTAGLLFMMAHINGGGFTQNTLDILQKNLDRLSTDSMRQHYLDGLNNVIATRGWQVQFVQGMPDANGNPTRSLQVQNMEGRPIAVPHR